MSEQSSQPAARDAVTEFEPLPAGISEQTSPPGVASVPVLPAKHPLAAKLTAILVALVALAAALIALDVIIVVRTAPAPIPAAVDVTISVSAQDSYAVIVLRGPGTTSTFTLDPTSSSQKLTKHLAGGESVQVDAQLTEESNGGDDYAVPAPNLSCQITDAAGQLLRDAQVSVKGGTASCAWTNDSKS